jgi:hypothetical protein
MSFDISIGDFLLENILSPFLPALTVDELSVLGIFLCNWGIGNLLGKRQFDISIGDFLLDNFLGPFLTDLTNGALSVLGSSLGSLVNLLGKRH